MLSRALMHRLTRPVRNTAVPVLAGNGRGLRVRFGESALAIAVRGHEPKIESFLLDLLREGDVFYDIGANIGWYSLLAARRTGAPVLAFEPMLENAAIIGENARVNGLPVTVVPAAVTDRDGWETFQDRGSLQGRLEKIDTVAHAARRARRPGGVKNTVPVPAVTLDGWLAETGQPPPAVMKIDIEGAEVGALRGMSATLASARPTLLIEMHANQADVADTLDELGYSHAPMDAEGPTRSAPWWAHVFAQPPAAAP